MAKKVIANVATATSPLEDGIKGPVLKVYRNISVKQKCKTNNKSTQEIKILGARAREAITASEAARRASDVAKATLDAKQIDIAVRVKALSAKVSESVLKTDMYLEALAISKTKAEKMTNDSVTAALLCQYTTALFEVKKMKRELKIAENDEEKYQELVFTKLYEYSIALQNQLDAFVALAAVIYSTDSNPLNMQK